MKTPFLSNDDEEALSDFIHLNGDEIARELGLVPLAPDNQCTDSDLERLFAECRKQFIASRPDIPSAEDEDTINEDELNDFILFQGDEVEEEQGLVLGDDGRFSEEDQERLIAARDPQAVCGYPRDRQDEPGRKSWA